MSLPSASPPVWCSSCHVLLDESSPSCPLCGHGSIAEIRDPRVLAVLDLLGRGHGPEPDARADDANSTPQRTTTYRMDSNAAAPSPQLLFSFLSLLERFTRMGNRTDDEPWAGAPPPLSPSSGFSSGHHDGSSGEDFSFEFRDPDEGNDVMESDARTVRVGENIAGNFAHNDAPEEHSTNQESFFYPTVDIILHYFVQDEAVRYGAGPASKAAVAALPTSSFCQCLSGAEDACCAVCREAFETGEELKELPCKHFYHTACILPWLEMSSSCPLCRRELPAEDFSGHDGEESMGLPAEAVEPGLAVFEISGEGMHFLSFVLSGEQATGEELLQPPDRRDGESEDASETGAPQRNGNEIQLSYSHEAQSEMTTDTVHSEPSLELPRKEEMTAFSSRTDSFRERSMTEVSGTSHGNDEHSPLSEQGEFEGSNIVTGGQTTNQSLRVPHSAVDRYGSRMARGASGTQLSPSEDCRSRDSWYDEMESTSGLHDWETFVTSAVGNFLNWLRGTIHTSASNAEDNIHQS